jgi:hypothetical protein
MALQHLGGQPAREMNWGGKSPWHGVLNKHRVEAFFNSLALKMPNCHTANQFVQDCMTTVLSPCPSFAGVQFPCRLLSYLRIKCLPQAQTHPCLVPARCVFLGWVLPSHFSLGRCARCLLGCLFPSVLPLHPCPLFNQPPACFRHPTFFAGSVQSQGVRVSCRLYQLPARIFAVLSESGFDSGGRVSLAHNCP